MKLVDTHAHLDFDQYAGQQEEVLQRAAAAGVDRIINVGTTLDGSRKSIELAERHDTVWATVGVHPHDAATVTDQLAEQLHELAQHRKVVAIGEIGFDFHYDDGPTEIDQERAFLRQAAVAGDLDLPIIVHSRDAESTTVRYLQRLMEHWNRQEPGVIHCFTGTKAFAEVCLEMGFYVSFTGTITFPKNEALREVVKAVPIDRLLVETDCPFLAPQEWRGQTNQPAYVTAVAEEIARVRDLQVAEVAEQTTANAERLFGLA